MNYIGICMAVNFFLKLFFLPYRGYFFFVQFMSFCRDQSKHAGVNSFYKGMGKKIRS